MVRGARVVRVIVWLWRIVAAFVAMVSGTLLQAATMAWSFAVGVWPVLVSAAAGLWYESWTVAALVVAGLLAVWFMLRRRR